MELDEVLEVIGSYGRYQVIVYLLISFFDNFLSIWHMSVMAFLGFEPEHYCKVGCFFSVHPPHQRICCSKPNPDVMVRTFTHEEPSSFETLGSQFSLS